MAASKTIRRSSEHSTISLRSSTSPRFSSRHRTSQRSGSSQKHQHLSKIPPHPRVLVTGATGFLGRHLVPALLEKKYPVTCLVRSDPGPGLWSDCTVVFGGLQDTESVEQAMAGVQVVIHCAAVLNAKHPDVYQSINVEGTRSLVRQAKLHDVTHFIFISTVDVGHGTMYGTTKEEAESVVKASGIPYTILRPGPIYGEGDNKNLMELFELVKSRRIIPVIGDGNYLRQPIHVDEVVRSIIAVIGSSKALSKIYYLGGPSITYNEILAALIEASENRPTIVHLSPGLAKLFVLALNKFGLGPNLSEDQIRTIDHDKVGDTRLFHRDFGLQAQPFKQGFTRMLSGNPASGPSSATRRPQPSRTPRPPKKMHHPPTEKTP